MKALMMKLLFVSISLLPITQVLADRPCSTQAMAGNWVYASSVSQAIGPDGVARPITSIGTINVDKHGNVSGKFDVAILGVFFIPDNTYVGTLTVAPDCTGTLYFLQSNGFERMDSIVVVNRSEMLGMSQDPNVIFTYQVRRISSKPVDDDD